MISSGSIGRPPACVEFCVRRLRGGVGLLASRRAGTNGGLGGEEVRRLQPLSADDLQRLLRERAPAPLTRRSLARIHAASGGNPFYALELARALPAGRAASAALPLPSTLEDVVGARLAELGDEAEEALLAVAALAKPTVALLEQALGPGVTAPAGSRRGARRDRARRPRRAVRTSAPRTRCLRARQRGPPARDAPTSELRRPGPRGAGAPSRVRGHRAGCRRRPRCGRAVRARARGAGRGSRAARARAGAAAATRHCVCARPSTTSTPATCDGLRYCSKRPSSRCRPARSARGRCCCSPRPTTRTTAFRRPGSGSNRPRPKPVSTSACA